MPSMPPRSTKAPKSLMAVTTPGTTAPTTSLARVSAPRTRGLLLQQRAAADHQVDAPAVGLVAGDLKASLRPM